LTPPIIEDIFGKILEICKENTGLIELCKEYKQNLTIEGQETETILTKINSLLQKQIQVPFFFSFLSNIFSHFSFFFFFFP